MKRSDRLVRSNLPCTWLPDRDHLFAKQWFAVVFRATRLLFSGLRLYHLYRKFRSLEAQVAEAIEAENLLVASVLSGNRNFEGRIHPQIKANYLASPPLVVAYAIAGSIRKDLTKEPLAIVNDEPVYLSDIWPSNEEVNAYVQEYVGPEAFRCL